MRIRLIFSVILSLMIACDQPFSTRTPEKPNTSQSSWTPPHTPEDVLINLTHSIQERNPENYTRCFINDPSSSRVFTFQPDPEAAALYPHLQGWTLDQEKRVIQQTFSIVPEDSSLSLEFIEEIRDVISPDSVAFIRNYNWSIHHTDQSLPVILEGQAEIRLCENSVGEWAIYRWIDNRISELPSWSIWKAALGGAE